MGRKRLLDIVDVDPKYFDVKNWPTVLIENLKQEQKEIYNRRKQAVEMYLKNHTHDEIKEITALGRKEVSRYINRCLSYDDKGVIWGYRGLVPQKNLASYQRKTSFDQLEQLTEVLIANYNREPHSGLGYLSPLEVMEQRIMQRDMLPRVMPDEQRNEVDFLSYTTLRTISGSIKYGKRPYITFLGVAYRNEVLSRSFGLIGEKINLLVNIKDLRVVRAYLSDGSEFGYLTATGKWGITPHTLQMRKQINQLITRKILYITHTDDPIEYLQRYLEEEAIKKKKPRNQLESLRRYQQQTKERNNEVKLGNEKKTMDVQDID